MKIILILSLGFISAADVKISPWPDTDQSTYCEDFEFPAGTLNINKCIDPLTEQNVSSWTVLSKEPPTKAKWCATSVDPSTKLPLDYAYCIENLKSCNNSFVDSIKWIKDRKNPKYCYSVDIQSTFDMNYTNSRNTPMNIIFPKPLESWFKSRDVCRAFGGELLSITSSQEFYFIKNLILSSSSAGAIWLGLNDLLKEGIWEWTDKSPLSLANWIDGQPNSYGGMEEDCIGLKTSDGRWGDTPCQRNSFFYMCKITDPDFIDDGDKTSNDLTDNCPKTITSPDNTTVTPDKIECYCSSQSGYEKVGKKCLKITQEADSWSEVQALCEKDGGYLAVFDENKDQYEIFRQWIQQKAERHNGHPRVWFGLTEKNLTSVTRGSYTSITANFHQYFGYSKSTFNEFTTDFIIAPLTQWGWNQPQRARISNVALARGRELEGVHCVELNSFTGLWSVGNCDSKRRGLCQRKMDSRPLGEKVEPEIDDNVLHCGSIEWKVWFDLETNTTFCYKMTDEIVRFDDASISCEPGYLATVHSQPEHSFINAILFKNDPAGAWIDVQVIKNTSTSIPDLIEYGIEMVETVHGPYKNRQMDIIFENWNTNSRQEYGDSFNKSSVDRMCGFMSVHGMWEVDACAGSQRHKAICKRVAVNNTEPDLLVKFDDRYSFSKMLKELSNGFANYDDLFSVSDTNSWGSMQELGCPKDWIPIDFPDKVAANKTGSESNIWLCILPIQQHGADASKVIARNFTDAASLCESLSAAEATEPPLFGQIKLLQLPEKVEMDRVSEQLGLQGKLHGSKNEFWVNLQKEPKTGQWLWNNLTENVLKYTTSNFGQWSMLKGVTNSSNCCQLYVHPSSSEGATQTGGTGFLDSRPCSEIKDFICMATPMYPNEAEKFQNESIYPAILSLEKNEIYYKNCTGADGKFNGIQYSLESSIKTSCYFFSRKGPDERVSYHVAKRDCTAMGGNIVTIETEIENKQIDTLLQLIDEDYYFWIGLNSLESREQKWQWESGVSVFYTNWMTGQPSNINQTERCSFLEPDLAASWGDTNCGTKKQYICELETQNKPPRGHDIDSYKPVNGGWCPAGTFQFGKSCYWIFAAADSKMSFAEARDFCRLEEGRDLASFDSADSLNYVLSNSCNNETIHPTINSLWIGLADHRSNAKFEWLDNSELVFSNWAAGEPKSNQGDRSERISRMMDLLLSSSSNPISQVMSPSMRLYFDGAGKNEECVSMSVNSWDSGSWYEEDCTQKRGFICMHKKWNTKEVKERCKDKPPASDRNMCKRAAAIQGRCQILTKRQRMKCLRSCKLCHKSQARYMNRPADANTASCPKLSSLSVSGDEFNMKRKPQGKNCISTKVFKRRREIIRKNFSQARVYCAAALDRNKLQGKLLSIDTDCKEKFILSMLSDDGSDSDDEAVDDDDESESSGPQAWIGLKYNKTAQRFEWENGAKFEHDMWSPDEPDFQKLFDNSTDHTCVSIDITSGRWSLTDCSKKLAFFCIHEYEKPNKIDDKNRIGHCITPQSATTTVWKHGGDKCYYQVDQELKFYDAALHCRSMDAEVLFVEDRTETEFILREFTPGARKLQTSEGDYLGYWLGIYNTSMSDSRGLSFYSDPERSISYLNFAPGEPTPENKCFSINAKTGYWQATNCVEQGANSKLITICVRPAIMAVQDSSDATSNTKTNVLPNQSHSSSPVFQVLFGLVLICFIAFAVYHYRQKLPVVQSALSNYHPAWDSDRWLTSNFLHTTLQRRSNTDDSYTDEGNLIPEES